MSGVAVGSGAGVGATVGSGCGVGSEVGSGAGVGIAVGSGVAAGSCVGANVGSGVAAVSGVAVALGVDVGATATLGGSSVSISQATANSRSASEHIIHAMGRYDISRGGGGGKNHQVRNLVWVDGVSPNVAGSLQGGGVVGKRFRDVDILGG